jgi:hypothetical protein
MAIYCCCWCGPAKEHRLVLVVAGLDTPDFDDDRSVAIVLDDDGADFCDFEDRLLIVIPVLERIDDFPDVDDRSVTTDESPGLLKFNV